MPNVNFLEKEKISFGHVVIIKNGGKSKNNLLSKLDNFKQGMSQQKIVDWFNKKYGNCN